MDDRLDSSCYTREEITSELSSRLSAPLASMATRSLSSRSVAPEADDFGEDKGRLGRRFCKASDGVTLAAAAVIARRKCIGAMVHAWRWRQ